MNYRYLFKGKEKYSEKWLGWNAIAGIPHNVSILSDTICQCTGLKDKNGKLIDVKFVKGCQNVPTEPCIIVVRTDNMNVDTRRRYPCLWVKNVEEIKPVVYNNSSLDEYF